MKTQEWDFLCIDEEKTGFSSLPSVETPQGRRKIEILETRISVEEDL
jgi:hypothetical protein